MTNVLVIMGDEHQARALGCAGHRLVETPHLDRLARRGVRFTNAWTPSPICVPARASFATGRWVHDVGAWDSARAFTGKPRGWAHATRDAGHETVSFGKLHHRAATDDDGFTDRRHPMFIAGGVGWVQGLPRRDPLPYPEAAELAEQTGVGHTTYTRFDERIATEAERWLASPPTTPWAAFVSFVAPHYPLSAPHEFSDRYPLHEVPPPEISERAIEHPAVAAMADFFAYHRFFDHDRTIEARRAYYALCSWVDHQVGRVLAALEVGGQLDDTLVIYTSDHGEMAGNRGLWCKSFMWRDAVDVPLLMAGPGVEPATVCDTNVNLVDIAPTITTALGVDAVGGAGSDLCAIAAGADRDRLGFSEYHDGGSVTGSFAVQHGRWKYIEHVGHAPQLFDVMLDPDELDDLGERPGLEAIRAECRDALCSIVDPEAADRAAFTDQERRLAALGGREAVATAFRFNHTPVPQT